jgi:hypothetical protein
MVTGLPWQVADVDARRECDGQCSRGCCHVKSLGSGDGTALGVKAVAFTAQGAKMMQSQYERLSMWLVMRRANASMRA